MDEKRKQAYRYLLYQAMIFGKSHNGILFSLNPIKIKRQTVYLKNIATLNYWLHNLAFYNYTNEWDKFNERMFWEEYEYWIKNKPKLFSKNYKDIFEKELERLNKE